MRVKNRLMIKYASKITLIILSFTVLISYECIFESHNRKKKKTKANSKNGEFVLRQPEVTSLSHDYFSKSDKIFYPHYILPIPALFYAQSTE